MEGHFTPYQVRHIALTLKGCKDLIGEARFREVAEEFADMFKVDGPRFDERDFLARCGVVMQAGEGMVAKVPLPITPMFRRERNVP